MVLPGCIEGSVVAVRTGLEEKLSVGSSTLAFCFKLVDLRLMYQKSKLRELQDLKLLIFQSKMEIQDSKILMKKSRTV